MFKFIKPSAMAVGVAVLAACGGNSSPTATVSPSMAHGTLVYNPPFRIASANAATLQAQLGATAQGAQLLQLTGNPTCGVDFYYVKFWTVGGAGEQTESSGALMVPTGAAPACSGPRPIVEYAHGTQTDKAANIADITNPANAEGALIAAMFAAQGYIVVAPNYAGYDISTLGYHPFFNAVQQSGEMMDILAAARTALPNTMTSATSDNGQLFLSGYSEGGYVAMATLRAMQAAGQKVTASAPGSGLYALEAESDLIIYGGVALGATAFIPLFANSYQHAYNNIDNTANPLFSPTYAGAETLLPSDTPIDTIFEEGLLPETQAFDSTTPVVPGQPVLTALLGVPPTPGLPPGPQTPLFQLGFGNPFLIENNFRVSYALDAATNPDGAVPTLTPGVPVAKTKPTQGLRQDLWVNDLRNGAWAPMSPTLLCGGDQDPTVYFQLNTEVMAAFWSALPAGLVTVLDVDADPTGPFHVSQLELLAYLQTPAGGGLSLAAAEQALVQGYHTNVAPFCTAAARAFFSQF
jgi:predicted dienelactone hydrolase